MQLREPTRNLIKLLNSKGWYEKKHSKGWTMISPIIPPNYKEVGDIKIEVSNRYSSDTQADSLNSIIKLLSVIYKGEDFALKIYKHRSISVTHADEEPIYRQIKRAFSTSSILELNKNVQLKSIKGEDHWIIRKPTTVRIQVDIETMNNLLLSKIDHVWLERNEGWNRIFSKKYDFVEFSTGFRFEDKVETFEVLSIVKEKSYLPGAPSGLLWIVNIGKNITNE